MKVSLPDKQWDVFISHAGEDKEAIARPIAILLKKLGVNVWFDEDVLTIGDSLSRVIDTGLAFSRYGIVILSPAFLRKDWTEFELRGLTAKEIGRDKVILPIWHDIKSEDLLKYSPTLADKIALSTSNLDIISICLKIIAQIRPDLLTAINRKIAFKFLVSNGKKISANIAELKNSPPRHESLPEDLLRRIRLVRSALLDVYPHSMQHWIDGFRCDAHPTSEVSVWEDIAAKFLELKSRKNIKEKYYSSVFQSLLLASMGIYHEAAKKIAKLPNDVAKSVIDTMKAKTPLNDFDDRWPEPEDVNVFNDGADEDLDVFLGDEANISEEVIDLIVKDMSKNKLGHLK
jgi:hypothetical protein